MKILATVLFIVFLIAAVLAFTGIAHFSHVLGFEDVYKRQSVKGVMLMVDMTSSSP